MSRFSIMQDMQNQYRNLGFRSDLSLPTFNEVDPKMILYSSRKEEKIKVSVGTKFKYTIGAEVSDYHLWTPVAGINFHALTSSLNIPKRRFYGRLDALVNYAVYTEQTIISEADPSYVSFLEVHRKQQRSEPCLLDVILAIFDPFS